MPDEAVMDAPEIALGGESLDTSQDFNVGDAVDATPAEPSTELSEESTEVEGEQPEQDASTVIEGKRLSPAVLKALEPIKATNPKLYKELVHAQFLADRFKRELPGGFNDIKQMQERLNEIGGEDGIKQTRAELQQWDSFDQKFTAGDPAFIDELTADADSQAAFLKHMPTAISKFAQLHPDGYKQHIARVVQNDFRNSEVPLMMARLGDRIADNPQAMQMWEQLQSYLNGWKDLASKDVQAPALAQQNGGPLNEREQKIQQQERALIVRDWSSAANTERMSIFNQNWTRLTNGMKLSPGEQADIRELYASRMTRALEAEGIKDKALRFVQANDRAGYLRLMKSLYEKNIPTVLSAIVKSRGAKLASKAPVQNGQQPTNGAPAARPGTPTAGFAWIGKPPQRDTIDWGKTSHALYSQGKAVQVGGKKVQWQSVL